jgi:conjugative transfer signal peptidase TraF
MGLYWVVEVPPVLHRGELVTFRRPASVAAFWSWRTPLLKPIAGVPGDLVCIESSGVSVAGRHYGPVLHADSQGTPLPVLRGCQVVPPGQVFVASPQPRSLDSRYYGPLPVSQIRARALPVWTW